MKLRITEIFLSLQGETRTVGIPTVFIRLTGCPLRCQYCDTAYAFQGGEMMDIAAILDRISQFGTRVITVTGGEPLAQKDCLLLLWSNFIKMTFITRNKMSFKYVLRNIL